MSTKDPNGDGGGGGTLTTSVVENVTPGTPSTDMAVLPGSQHSQHHQHPPPSPLSGCYLLVVLPEPHTAQHRDLILNRLAKGKFIYYNIEGFPLMRISVQSLSHANDSYWHLYIDTVDIGTTFGHSWFDYGHHLLRNMTLNIIL